MSQHNRKKLSISLSISETLLKKMTFLVESGQFSTISDLVYVSLCEFLGILSFCEKNDFYSLEDLLESVPDDVGQKVSVSVTVNIFIYSELKRISKQTYKNQSVIMRKAILYFIENYNKKPAASPKKTPKCNFPESEIELKKFIIQTVMELKESEKAPHADT